MLDKCPNSRHFLVIFWTFTSCSDTVWAQFGHFLSKMCPYSHRSGAPRRRGFAFHILRFRAPKLSGDGWFLIGAAENAQSHTCSWNDTLQQANRMRCSRRAGKCSPSTKSAAIYWKENKLKHFFFSRRPRPVRVLALIQVCSECSASIRQSANEINTTSAILPLNLV